MNFSINEEIELNETETDWQVVGPCVDTDTNWWCQLLPRTSTSHYVTLGEFLFRLFGAFVATLIICATLFGNTLVIIVVRKFHRMKTVTNILLASLAMADITVGLFVMPFQLIYDYNREWPFGPIICHFWISCDVMCCTASILHLCVIAVDRYWSIYNPLRYRALVNKRKLCCLISGVWICSVAISFVPIFCGWYHDGSVGDIFSVDSMPNCGLKVNPTYAVISSSISFYVPLVVMFYLYFQILIVAERQSREIKKLERSLKQNGFLSGSYLDHENSNLVAVTDEKTRVERSVRKRAKQILTETKAIRTLGIVMGVFCISWLPYFIMYIVMSRCNDCEMSYITQSAITWLGFLNSSLNPVIYTFLNKEFRDGFRRVLHCSLPPNDSDAISEDMSTVSRSIQRCDRLTFEFQTTNPISRTPSTVPDTTA